MLTVALFVSARMGIYQEVLYKKHGKHPSEALYYTVRIAENCSIDYNLSILKASSSSSRIPATLPKHLATYSY